MVDKNFTTFDLIIYFFKTFNKIKNNMINIKLTQILQYNTQL